MTQKILGTRDVFFMNVAANLGPRWIAVAAALGAVSLLFWFLGAVFFLLPFSLIIVELACAYPEEGGMYVWVRKHLGGGCSFIVAWCYWLNNFFFYPAILTFLATSLVYAFGRPDLANDTTFITSIVILVFWAITGLTLFGIKMSKFTGSLGGIGTTLIFFMLIALGAAAIFLSHTSATPFHLGSFLPNGSLVDNLSSLSILMFAMAGVEVIPTLATSIRKPEIVLPKALIFFSFFMFFAYALATLSMNIILSPDEIRDTTGLINAFELVGAKFDMPYLARLIASFIAVSEVSALMLWILVPAIMFFKVTQKGILPPFFHRENKNGIPTNALLLQAVLVTIIILCMSLLPSVNLMYQALVLMTTIIYFIPYFFVLLAYIKFKRGKVKGPYAVPGGKVGAFLLSGMVFLSLTFAIGFSFVPTANLTSLHEILVYESELICGTVITLLVALILYRRRKKIQGKKSV